MTFALLLREYERIFGKLKHQPKYSEWSNILGGMWDRVNGQMDLAEGENRGVKAVRRKRKNPW